MNRLIATLALSATIMFAGAAQAAEIEVLMLNKGAKGAMVFEPDLIVAAPGDTIRFIPTDKGHNAEVIKGLFPKGGTEFKGKINEKLSVTFDVPGAYGYKCLPHFAMGMVGLIVVGDDPANLAAISEAKGPPKAKAKFEELAAMVGQQ